MENIVRSIYGANLQTSKLLGIPLSIPTSSTLNEKFVVQQTTAISPTDSPSMKYVTIGNGGHTLVTGANGISQPAPVMHRPTDAALFKHLPFVLRLFGNDLSAPERAKYGLRSIVTFNSVQYIAYYLKRLDLTGVTSGLDFKTVSNGTTVTTPFVPNQANLNPTPPTLDNNGVNVVTGNYVSATAKVPFSLVETDVTELLNVANIIYGNEGFAIISEIGLVSGVDKVVSVSTGGNGTFSYTEVLAAQLVSTINTFFSMRFNATGVDLLLDCGATEPMSILA